MMSIALGKNQALALGVACALAACFASVARAAEVVVKNDSVVDFGQAVIVGDFNAGEMAGVRLTSPCAGSIVAVQVVWLAGSPSAPQTLEEFITIHQDAGTFPIPGAVLAELEGPLLTPGFINEFRHLDEAGTIPIDVPVTLGQNFFVMLEFGEDTNVGGGSASVVRDTNGCQANRNILFANPGGYINFCLFLAGDLAIRAVVDCQDPLGACCDFNATCTNNVEQDECVDPGDTFFSGQTCAQVSCPTPTGACCNGTGGCLNNVTQTTCNGIPNGIYAGNGTTCAQNVCALGACCRPDGSCGNLIDLVCQQQDGIFEGPGTTCATTNCPQPLGACCIGTFCIPSQTEVNCSGFPGVWQGALTECEDPNPCLACTDGDADQDGDNDLVDFAAFQGCFGGPDIGPCACLDMDNDGDVDLQDLALFVAALSGP